MATREHMLELIALELERAEGLENAHVHIADLRDDKNVGPGVEAVLRAMQRLEIEANAEVQ
jgi:hypothetical protein